MPTEKESSYELYLTYAIPKKENTKAQCKRHTCEGKSMNFGGEGSSYEELEEAIRSYPDEPIATHNSAVVADLWGDKEVVAGVGRCTLEDPFKIGNWRGDRFLVHISAVFKGGEQPLISSKGGLGFVCPLRTRFFAWEAVWDKISTVDMLMRRGWSMVNRCNLCKENEESGGPYSNSLRAKSKNVPRGRDVRYELEEPLPTVSS
ncbi:hypothetical protein CK203_031189 [Vitis vinifera]|uniref:Reverse transcriptase zinc-binding domain-containing protein n=1 Tax=Vitis vinifera TaxID=29760 RepID=A0A438J0H2_VITVI|nr:hypothetical protein CK203_031189 [Vitis vinifera]